MIVKTGSVGKCLTFYRLLQLLQLLYVSVIKRVIDVLKLLPDLDVESSLTGVDLASGNNKSTLYCMPLKPGTKANLLRFVSLDHRGTQKEIILLLC